MIRERSTRLALCLGLICLFTSACQPVDLASIPAQLDPHTLGWTALAEAGLTVTLTTGTEAVTGPNHLQLAIVDAAGLTPRDLTVTVDLDMTTMCMSDDILTATPAGDGQFVLAYDFTMPGPWKLIALIDRPGQERATAEFQFDVSAR